MVDIHSHVLWGVDDGAHSFEESLEMLRMAAAAGTTDIVATPHSNSEYRFEPERIAEKIAQLEQALGGALKIHRGCDFHVSFENVDCALADRGKFTIDHRQYLLVEFPDLRVAPSTEAVLGRLLDAGLVPVVTHPERNPVLQNDLARLAQWVELGCLMQVTALSLSGGFGRTAKAASLALLDRGLVHFVASDAHDPVHRHPRLDKTFELLASLQGEETARCLLIDNPQRAVDGAPIPLTHKQARPATGWSRLWRSRLVGT